MTKGAARLFYRLVNPVVDMQKALYGIPRYMRFVRDLRRYSRIEKKDRLSFADLHPCIHDRREQTPFDPHYVYQNVWIVRELLKNRPRWHVDVGSHIGLVAVLSALMPVTFIDIRPLEINLPNLLCKKGSILYMPFGDYEVSSLSCLHVVEHIGLGRYGDALDVEGSKKAIEELARVLVPGGLLYLSLPIGRPRICFNAHRIHKATEIVGWLEKRGILIKNHAGVLDDGRLEEQPDLAEMDRQSYCCGLFVFQKDV